MYRKFLGLYITVRDILLILTVLVILGLIVLQHLKISQIANEEEAHRRAVQEWYQK